MNEFIRKASERLGFRQRAYQAAFGVEDSPGFLALADLAVESRAFDADVSGLSHDELMVMHGRRQMFFRIFKHVKLTPNELEMVSRRAILRAAAGLAQQLEGDG